MLKVANASLARQLILLASLADRHINGPEVLLVNF